MFDDYTSNIEYAENMIISKKYGDASVYYKESLLYNEQAIGLDCYNAMMCALYLDDFGRVQFLGF